MNLSYVESKYFEELLSLEINPILKNKLISSNKTHVEPEKRNVALSFQDNSLFPNYKVIDNINFGKKRANGNASKIDVNEIIKLLHIEPILEKFPHQISAGEAQRVSLARSLMSKPELLLSLIHI